MFITVLINSYTLETTQSLRTDEWVQKAYMMTYTMECYVAVRKSEVMKFAYTSMNKCCKNMENYYAE